MLGQDAVGKRVVVRHLVPGQAGPSGGPLMSDVLGVLERITDAELVIRRDDGTLARVARATYLTGKPVPPRPSPRPRIEAEQLQRIASAGWPPRTVEPLGDWLLREAGGFTGRANSALIAGDPGRPLPDALSAVQRFYAGHQLPALAQVVLGSPGEAALLAAGWADSRPAEGGVLVQVAAVTSARRMSRPARGGHADAVSVHIDAALDADWLGLYGRVTDVVTAVARAVLSGGDRVAFARVGRPAVAIGRAVLTGDWVGLSAVEVAPALRCCGLARAVVEALLGWGAEAGATAAYLQVTPANIPAIRLYAAYGFRTHHRYRYLEPPR